MKLRLTFIKATRRTFKNQLGYNSVCRDWLVTPNKNKKMTLRSTLLAAPD
jgi:hypothetical protein